MARSPAAHGGTYRVTRTLNHVTEAYVTAGSVAAAKAAARALPAEGWSQRVVDQQAGTIDDPFEYNVVDGASDDGA